MRANAAVFVAVALAAVLVACGGDEEGPSRTAAPGGDAGAGSAATANRGDSGGEGEDGSAVPTDDGGAGSGEDSEPSSPPAPGFRDTSGVTDIPAYGQEGGSGLRATASRALNAYLAARRAGDLQRACEHLLPATRAQLAAVGAQAGRPGEDDCADGLRLSERLIADPYLDSAEVTALRYSGSGAFALFHGADGADYWVAMRRQRDDWLLISAIPQPLEPDGVP
ncbi:MAG TPA: hypothetical protein VFY04_08705 [Solirubrobacterales bacterium]|nr:hypothetical protein [Solirubrobacterales bacterium]